MSRYTPSQRAEVFEYTGFELDPVGHRVRCHYRLDDLTFTEEVRIPLSGRDGHGWEQPAAREVARLVHLLAGVSYYKAGAARVVRAGALTPVEAGFLESFYRDGLGEFAYRSEIDLSDVRFEHDDLLRVEPVDHRPDPGRPLVPFGGGIDSIVSAELLRPLGDSPALFVVNRPGDTFTAIEEPARVVGWPVVRAERALDEQVLRSRDLGFLNGHVPVTGVISAIAVLAAVLTGRDAVVMSNEWSASAATLSVDGRDVNHQYSKSAAFEEGFREVLAQAIGPQLQYFSLLRPFSELWIARRFARLTPYLTHFRSCNRAFLIDPAARAERWCGECDKCCFIDLILAPFVAKSDLEKVFDGVEPLSRPDLADRFRTLLALTPDAKPWECVGDVVESRAAARIAVGRPDRNDPATDPLLHRLASEADRFADPDPADLLLPLGRHFIPERYAPDPLVV